MLRAKDHRDRLLSVIGSLGIGLLCTVLLMGGWARVAMALPQSAPMLIAQAPDPQVAVIRAGSPSEIVERFSRTTQLYIKGRTLSDPEIAQLLQILEQNPNIYVVLIDNSSNVERDDLTLSRGIGNSSEFLSVVHPLLGERQGVLFMIYFDSDRGRQIYMRAEALPDRLGVGEAEFADAQGQPRWLLTLFVEGVQDQGLSVPLALERVIAQINSQIVGEANQQMRTAQIGVDQAAQDLSDFEEALARFRDRYSVGGEVGDPPVQPWRQDVEQAQQALQERQLEQVTYISQTLIRKLQRQQEWMERYQGSAEQIGPLREQQQRLQAQLTQLRDNDPARRAATLNQQVQESLQQIEVSLAVGDLTFWDAFQTAQAQIQSLETQVRSSQDQTRFNQQLGVGVATGGILLALGTGGVAYRRSSRRRRQAYQEWQAAQAQIGTMTQELLGLMDEADYRILAGYQGETQRWAQELIERVTDALTLIGGAETFLTEAHRLLQPRGPWDQLTTHRSQQAIRVLTDPETSLPFSLEDSSRAVLQGRERAASWRDWILAQTGSRQLHRSLQQVLLEMADNRDRAQVLLEQITHKSEGLGAYLDRIEAEAIRLRQHWQDLQAQTDQRLTIPGLALVWEHLLNEENPQGLISTGRQMLSAQDPIRGWDEYGQPAEALTQIAEQILQLSAQARSQVLPKSEQARSVLKQEDIETAWLDHQIQTLSERLDHLADQAQATPGDLTEELNLCGPAIETLAQTFDRAIQYSQQRRDLISHQIPALEAQVQTARDQICQTLQQRELFQVGTSAETLREPDHDPSHQIAQIHHHLDTLRIQLSRGNVDTAGTELQTGQDLYDQAQTVLQRSLEILESYPQRFPQLRTWRQRLQEQIPDRSRPTLERILNQYPASVYPTVAAEVNCGETIQDVIQRAERDLDRVQTWLDQGQSGLQQAALLQVDRHLTQSQELLQITQHHLDSLEEAEIRLRDRRQQAEGSLEALDQTIAQILVNSRATYIRQRTQDLTQQLQDHQAQARASLSSDQLDPYQAMTEISAAEHLCPMVEQHIRTDHQTFQAATRRIADAEAALRSAQREIDRTQIPFLRSTGIVQGIEQTLSLARQNLGKAEARLQRSRSDLRQQAYESAEDHAQAAQLNAERASREAKEAQERGRIEKEREERQAQLRSSSSFSSGGSFGGGSSSSGSTGGNFGGGGSGSSGGGW